MYSQSSAAASAAKTFAKYDGKKRSADAGGFDDGGYGGGGGGGYLGGLKRFRPDDLSPFAGGANRQVRIRGVPSGRKIVARTNAI